MFTGIVEEIGRVAGATGQGLTIGAREVLKGLTLGQSLAVNGVCLTVTAFTPTSFTIEVMPEPLRRTDLGSLKTGDRVNLERPLKFGGEMGGHLVQGHVDATGTLIAITREGDARILRLQAPPEVMRYIVEKGFIAVDGVSLTVAGLDADSFTVSIVGYTFTHTTLGERRPGDAVNLEVDIMAKYAERFSRPAKPAITAEFLREHGFMVN